MQIPQEQSLRKASGGEIYNSVISIKKTQCSFSESI
ncbi:hypothetical protein CPC698_1559, partial [Chlamydia psittaci C6/98]